MSTKTKADVKKDVASRIKRGLSGLGRRRSRVSRVDSKGSKLTTSKQYRPREKTVVKRKPAPEPSAKVKDIVVDNKDYGLWLGNLFDPAEMLTLTQIKDTFLEVVSHLEEHNSRKEDIENLLNEKLEDGTNLAAARQQLIEELDESKFNVLFSQYLGEIFESKNVSDQRRIGLRLVRALRPSVIVYHGIDKNIEASLELAKFPYKSFTALDLYAFQMKTDSADEYIFENIKDVYQDHTIIIRPAGVYTKVDSLSISLSERFCSLGLNDNGEFAPSVEVDLEVQAMRAVLESIGRSMPFLFLGNKLHSIDPISHFLVGMRTNELDDAILDFKEKPPVDDETNESFEEKEPSLDTLPIRHVALVKEVQAGERREEPNSIGIDYQCYTPHKIDTHIEEFLSKLVGKRTDIPMDFSILHPVIAADSVLKSAQFFTDLTQKESEASEIRIFTNSFVQLPFIMQDNYEERLKKEFMEHVREIEADDIVAAVTTRLNSFNKRLVREVPTVIDKKLDLESIDAGNDKDESNILPGQSSIPPIDRDENQVHSTQTKEPRESPVIKLLIPTMAGEARVRQSTQEQIELMEKLVNVVEDSNGRLELRFVETNKFLSMDFELLYQSNHRCDLAGIGLYAKELSEVCSVNFFEINTKLVEDKIVLFEKMWTQSLNATQSTTFLVQYLEGARSAFEEEEKERKRLIAQRKALAAKSSKITTPGLNATASKSLKVKRGRPKRNGNAELKSKKKEKKKAGIVGRIVRRASRVLRISKDNQKLVGFLDLDGLSNTEEQDDPKLGTQSSEADSEHEDFQKSIADRKPSEDASQGDIEESGTPSEPKRANVQGKKEETPAE